MSYEIQHKIPIFIPFLGGQYAPNSPVYAHSDPNSNALNVDNPELELLINLAMNIYNNIFGKLYDVTMLFEHTTDWKIDYPIEALAKIRQKRN
jgi:hypothetical protein